MKEIQIEVNRLVQYGLQKGLLKEEDRFYAANRLLCRLGLQAFEACEISEVPRYPAEILERLCDYAVKEGNLADTQEARDQFDTELMDCLMPRPSEVSRTFWRLYETDRRQATDYYYDLSRSSNYIRVDRVEKDRMWTAKTNYGEMIVTINLSKPEKDPKAIAAAKNAPQSGYPKCALCRENEGFTGSLNQAPRANHRLIPISLCEENWFLQYSPYVYYNEHCILLNETHKPMQVNRAAFERLLSFVEVLPHYFVGSNADLPIVGGSILSHEHFQGGCFEFPMAKAGLRQTISISGFTDVSAGIVDWPMSVIRLRHTNRTRLIDAASAVLDKWRGYTDESAEIFAFSEQEPHNTITPIARSRNDALELDLVLRNNRTTKAHPLGLFHPHAEYHHIKKENIGLIEVMGLAILPPRILTSMRLMQQALEQQEQAEAIFQMEDMKQHEPWYLALKERAKGQDVERLLQNSIGEIFEKILADAGVFKDTEQGRAAFLRFCETI